MSNYSVLKALLDTKFYENTDNEITGTKANEAVKAMVDSLGAGYQFMGVAHPTGTPSGYADLKCFWIAAEFGTYTNFGGVVVGNGEIAALVYDESGLWGKKTFNNPTQILQNLQAEIDGLQTFSESFLLSRVEKYAFVANSHDVYYNNSGVIGTTFVGAESNSCGPIAYPGGTIKLKQTGTSGYIMLLFADDSDNYKGRVQNDGTNTEYTVTPPSGTTRIYWNNVVDNPAEISFEIPVDVSRILSFASGHRIVEIPAGTYTLGAAWSVPSNTLIRGAIGATIIQGPGLQKLLDIGSGKENITIENITFEGDKNITGRGEVPAVADLANEQAMPYGVDVLQTTYFSADNAGKAYIPTGSVPAVSELSIGDWTAMNPIAIPAGVSVIRATYVQTSSQRCLYFVNSDNSQMSVLPYASVGEIVNIPSWATQVYWALANNNDFANCKIEFGNIGAADDVGIYVADGARNITISNCELSNFGLAGLYYKNMVASGYGRKLRVLTCKFINNWNGVILAERGEFAQLIGCEFFNNQIGVWTCAANSCIFGSTIVQNLLFGLVMVGGYENSIHCVVNGCEIVHNGFNAGNVGTPNGTYDVVFVNAVAGISLVGCLLGIDGIMIYSSQGINLTGCQFICPIYFDGSIIGGSLIAGNIWRKHAALGTIINGDDSHATLSLNRFAGGGDYSEINNDN